MEVMQRIESDFASLHMIALAHCLEGKCVVLVDASERHDD